MPSTPAPTHALSICQPWASLIAAGHKRIENRTWQTAYRGVIAIHASSATRHFTPESEYFLLDIANPALRADLDGPKAADFFQFGAIIGIAELVDILPLADAAALDGLTGGADDLTPITAAADGKIPYSVFADGPLCWQFENAVFFDSPIVCKGKLNLWPLGADLEKAVAAELLRTKAGQVKAMEGSRKGR